MKVRVFDTAQRLVAETEVLERQDGVATVWEFAQPFVLEPGEYVFVTPDSLRIPMYQDRTSTWQRITRMPP